MQLAGKVLLFWHADHAGDFTMRLCPGEVLYSPKLSISILQNSRPDCSVVASVTCTAVQDIYTTASFGPCMHCVPPNDRPHPTPVAALSVT